MIKITMPILAIVAALSLSACTKEESNNQGEQKLQINTKPMQVQH